MALKASFRPQIERVNNSGYFAGTWRQGQLPRGQTAKVRLAAVCNHPARDMADMVPLYPFLIIAIRGKSICAFVDS
jgi:hypothetical protein